MPRSQILAFFIALTLLVFVSGCQHYTVTMRVDADGGGLRETRFRSDTGGLPADSAQAALTTAFALDPAIAWTFSSGPPDILDYRFHRILPVATIEEWRDAGGEIRIPGQPGSDRPQRVELSNEIEVSREAATGELVYRERILWRGVVVTLGDLFADLLLEDLGREYPGLNAAELSELRGCVAGATLHFLTLEKSNAEDEEYETFLGLLAEQLQHIMSRLGPAAELDRIRECAWQVFKGEDERGDEILDRELPGLQSAFTTDLDLTLEMPGTVVESNADSLAGKVARWRVDLSDALLAPVEMYARCARP